jgi:hypothetical protein
VKIAADGSSVNFGQGNPRALANANGGIYAGGVKAFADSGFEPGIYPYTPGGIHKFAEEYGEAYISMDPARRDRSQAVWVRSGQELGMFSRAGAGAVDATPSKRVSVTQHIVIQHPDATLAARQLGREAERAFAST